MFVRWLSACFLLLVMTTMPSFVHAQTAASIQAQIDANNKQLAALKEEIAAYQRQLDQLGEKKNTLQSAIDTLSLSQKQLTAQIQATQNKISSANLQIKELSNSISDTEDTIEEHQSAIGKALRTIAENENESLITQLVSSHTLRDAWQVADEALQFNTAVAQNIRELRAAKTELSKNRDAVTTAKNDLVSLQNELSLQKRSVDASKKAQQQLLSSTRNEESAYQRMLVQKQAAERSFEQELASLQSQLNLIVHPELLPRIGSGVLRWPFTLSFMSSCANRKGVFGNLYCITQYFGNTPFSTANPQVYNGRGHTAIDIGAPIGTPITAALDGVVLGTGNTDLARGCYSYGKWVMVKHANGLSTLYAHLSSIDVSPGQSVASGQVVGLSGMTGYATGPHLHFGVYATEGTKIMTLREYRGATSACAGATMPVATATAYLNPLSYL